MIKRLWCKIWGHKSFVSIDEPKENDLALFFVFKCPRCGGERRFISLKKQQNLDPDFSKLVDKTLWDSLA